MKQVLLLFSLLLLGLTYACNNTNSSAKNPPPNVETDSANFTQVVWTDSIQDFGTVPKGEKVHITYHCKNTGNKPLFIVYARPGCGCTVADYTKQAIAPGGTGEVNAEFDSNHGNPGHIRKTISVRTNTTNRSPVLIFTGEVSAPDSTKKSS